MLSRGNRHGMGIALPRPSKNATDRVLRGQFDRFGRIQLTIGCSYGIAYVAVNTRLRLGSPTVSVSRDNNRSLNRFLSFSNTKSFNYFILFPIFSIL